MRIVRGFAIVLFAFSLALPRAVRSTSTTGPIDPERALDPLLYSHLVLECTIKSVRHRTATNRELNIPSNPDRKKGILIAELSDVTLLRGPDVPKEVMVGFEPSDFIGERVILCCYWLPTLDLYTARFSWLVFRQEGDRWVGLEWIVGLPPEKRASFSPLELHTLLQQVEVAELARKAERIIIGCIGTVVDSTVVTPHATIPVQKLTLDVENVLKGDRSTRTAWFFATGDPVAEMGNVVTPRKFRVGETWIAFLGREGNVYYPLGGVNGLLLLDGQKVFFDRTVECSYSRSALARAIDEAINE